MTHPYSIAKSIDQRHAARPVLENNNAASSPGWRRGTKAKNVYKGSRGVRQAALRVQWATRSCVLPRVSRGSTYNGRNGNTMQRIVTNSTCEQTRAWTKLTKKVRHYSKWRLDTVKSPNRIAIVVHRYLIAKPFQEYKLRRVKEYKWGKR